MSCINKETEYLTLKSKGLTDDKVIYDLIAHKEKLPQLYKKKIPCETLANCFLAFLAKTLSISLYISVYFLEPLEKLTGDMPLRT